MQRALYKPILDDLKTHIVLLHGPRQCGKTWLAKEIMKKYPRSLYLNYDNLQDKEIIHDMSWLKGTPLLVFDEIHKMPEWSSYIKGIFDTQAPDTKILVTGSANLELKRRGGDSMAGRYRSHHLFPFSIDEVEGAFSHVDLYFKGGFPEPFLEESETRINRWRKEYFESLLTTDVLNSDEQIRKIDTFPLLTEILRSKVGSPLSLQNIAQDLSVSQPTVQRYLNILETMNVIFLIYPYHRNIQRAIKKAPKVYFYDTAYVEEESGRYENFLALELLNAITRKNDLEGTALRQGYIRNTKGQEVDFVIYERDSILALYEAKYAKAVLDKNLIYFANELDMPGAQVLLAPHHERNKDLLEVISIKTAASRWLPNS